MSLSYTVSLKVKLSSEIFYRQLNKVLLRGHKNDRKVPEKETIQCKDIRLLFRCQEEQQEPR